MCLENCVHLFRLELTPVVACVQTLGERLLAPQAEVTLSPFPSNTRVYPFDRDCRVDRPWLLGIKLIFFPQTISIPHFSTARPQRYSAY